MEKPGDTPKSFEETYPRYPFSRLVRLGIALAKLLRRLLDRRHAPGSVGRRAERPFSGTVGT